MLLKFSRKTVIASVHVANVDSFIALWPEKNYLYFRQWQKYILRFCLSNSKNIYLMTNFVLVVFGRIASVSFLQDLLFGLLN
jgi:hypothetical protein